MAVAGGHSREEAAGSGGARQVATWRKRSEASHVPSKPEVPRPEAEPTRSTLHWVMLHWITLYWITLRRIRHLPLGVPPAHGPG